MRAYVWWRKCCSLLKQATKAARFVLAHLKGLGRLLFRNSTTRDAQGATERYTSSQQRTPSAWTNTHKSSPKIKHTPAVPPPPRFHVNTYETVSHFMTVMLFSSLKTLNRTGSSPFIPRIHDPTIRDPSYMYTSRQRHVCRDSPSDFQRGRTLRLRFQRGAWRLAPSLRNANKQQGKHKGKEAKARGKARLTATQHPRPRRLLLQRKGSPPMEEQRSAEGRECPCSRKGKAQHTWRGAREETKHETSNKQREHDTARQTCVPSTPPREEIDNKTKCAKPQHRPFHHTIPQNPLAEPQGSTAP